MEEKCNELRGVDFFWLDGESDICEHPDKMGDICTRHNCPKVAVCVQNVEYP